MTLTRMTLKSFGCFQNKTFEFSKGLNVLYGSNGSGKSTLIHFLLWMFYDPKNLKKEFRGRLRERFRPWDGTALAGELEFLWEGVSYRMERFYDTPSKKRFSVVNNITGEDVTDRFLPTPGEVLFGFGQEAFLRTFFVGQLSASFEKETKEDELMTALLNLSCSGNETVSAQKALKALEDASRKLQPKKGSGGEIHAVEANIDRISGLLEERRHREAELYLTIKRLDQVTAAIEEQKRAKAAKQYAEQSKRKQQLLDLQQEAETLKKEREQLKIQLLGIDLERLPEAEEACRTGKDIQEQKRQMLEEQEALKLENARKEEQIRVLAEERKKKVSVLRWVFVLCGVLLLAGSVAGMLAQRIMLPILLLTAFSGMMFLCGAFAVGRKSDVIEEEPTSARLVQLQCALKGAEEQLSKETAVLQSIFGRTVLEDEIRLTLSRAEALKRNALQTAEWEKRYALLSELELEAEVTEPPTPYRGAAFDEEQFRSLLTEKGSLSAALESGFAGLSEEHLLQEQLLSERETLKDLYERRDALLLAHEMIEETAEEMRHSFGPQLNRAAGAILSELTDGAVQNVRISSEYKMELTDDGGNHVLDYFSNGTVDQAYLALRIGILDLLQKNNCGPLFLDDVFCQYDEKRLSCGLRFLAERAVNQQILYCTCRSEACPENVHVINLDGLF